ncbi:hypothetical protein CSUI_009119 [Cystoisospora suis]|uniref:Uncharacterized protein n=1 Tax=Cystoisospora suis TaxID=483139 RepID=A0A2C6K5B6_9APIC|nr:hypothetical protein CSUI_009119 [Cystoisospora suis]
MRMENDKDRAFPNSGEQSLTHTSSDSLLPRGQGQFFGRVLLSAGSSYARPAAEEEHHPSGSADGGRRKNGGDTVTRRASSSSIRGRGRGFFSGRGRPVGLSLLLLSFTFLLVRRVASNCAYLFSKGRSDDTEAVIEGRPARLLASGAEDKNSQLRASLQDSFPSDSLSAASVTQCVEAAGITDGSLARLSREAQGRWAGHGGEQASSGDGQDPKSGPSKARIKKKRPPTGPGEGHAQRAAPPFKVSRLSDQPAGRVRQHPTSTPPSGQTTVAAGDNATAQEDRRPPAGGTRQVQVVQELSDSEEEVAPDPPLHPAPSRGRLPRTGGTGQAPFRVGEEPPKDFSLERENIMVLDRGLSAFREKLNIYLDSIVLDTPQKQKMWDDGLSVRAASKTCREAVFRERRAQTPGAAASVFRALLSVEYYIGRDVALIEKAQSAMSPWHLHIFRVAQLSVESNLIRAGFPPSSTCEIQNEMLEHLGELCQPLNYVGYYRSVRNRQWIKEQGEITEAKLWDILHRTFSVEIDQDRKVVADLIHYDTFLTRLEDWARRQPPRFFEAVQPDTVLGRMLGRWGLLPQQEMGTGPDWTPPETGLPLPTDIPGSHTSANGSPASLDPSALARGISSPVVSELLETFLPHLDMSLIPLASDSNRTEWTMKLVHYFKSVRVQLSNCFAKLYTRGVRRTFIIDQLLERLALIDFALCLARYALNHVPELENEVALKEACVRAEETAIYTWERLGIYGSAARWTRRGIASLFAQALSPTLQHPRSATDDLEKTLLHGVLYLALFKEKSDSAISSGCMDVTDLRPGCKNRLRQHDLPLALARWMQRNPDPSAASNITENSRLFRALFPSGMRGPVILRGPSSDVMPPDVVQHLVSPSTVMRSSDASSQQLSPPPSTEGLSNPVIPSTAGHRDRPREADTEAG